MFMIGKVLFSSAMILASANGSCSSENPEPISDAQVLRVSQELAKDGFELESTRVKENDGETWLELNLGSCAVGNVRAHLVIDDSDNVTDVRNYSLGGYTLSGVPLRFDFENVTSMADSMGGNPCHVLAGSLDRSH